MNRDLNVTVFNQIFQMPIGLSPTARQKRWTPEGEIATVKGEAKYSFQLQCLTLKFCCRKF